MRYSVKTAYLNEPWPSLGSRVINGGVWDDQLDMLIVDGVRIPIHNVREFTLSAKAAAQPASDPVPPVAEAPKPPVKPKGK